MDELCAKCWGTGIADWPPVRIKALRAIWPDNDLLLARPFYKASNSWPNLWRLCGCGIKEEAPNFWEPLTTWEQVEQWLKEHDDGK